MDEDKVKENFTWSTSKTGTTVRIFHRLTQFYKNFIKNFSEICSPMMETIKGGMKIKFVWRKRVDE